MVCATCFCITRIRRLGRYLTPMGDLYFDDITDERMYPSTDILRDVRSFIDSGQREGQMLDYKVDVSPKDNWPETVAAFANSFGGLIIFGWRGNTTNPAA